MKDIVKENRDMRYLNWTVGRKSSGTAGSFLKAYDDTGMKKKYYKLSDYDLLKGIVGHECINEIIVQRLLGVLKIEHLEYRLIHARIMIDDKEVETYLCESEDFKESDENKIALEDYYAIEKKEGQLPLDFCMEMGWEEYIYNMLLVDYLVLNRDRHGANIEVLRSKKNKTIRLAPLFDHGLSLLCSCRNDEDLARFDVMEDKRIQSFVASNSAYENVKLVPKDHIRRITQLTEYNREILFDGLSGIIGNDYLEKIWEMIWRRWCSLDSI